MNGNRASAPSFGVVIIGRNEGARLRRCLDSVMDAAVVIVYVDSGSTDDSVAMARERGAIVVDLDMTLPFTAARARNAGLTRLCDTSPSIPYVQFVDGDCELRPGWLQTAARHLDMNVDVACVCGRLRERFPERSIYNRLCDFEWDRPEGEAESCGGIAMFRANVVTALGGFRQTLIAGEEPELCLRIRRHGARVWRLGDEMAWHDADMQKFSQWWRRTMRGGYAAAEGTVMYGTASGTAYARKLGRIAFWAAGFPLAIAALASFDPRMFLVAVTYPLQVARLALRRDRGHGLAWVEALFQMLANFPEGAGAAMYFLDRARRRRGRLIEYR